MEKKEEVKEEKKKPEKYSIIEVPTQTALVIKDNETEEVYSELELLRRIAEDINSIKKNLTR